MPAAALKAEADSRTAELAHEKGEGEERIVVRDGHPAHPAERQADHQTFGRRDLSGNDHVYVWTDGIHPRMRLREAKSCVPVLMGVRADGAKELIAMSDGCRESAGSWADLLRDCR
ncbi:transposase [Streptomyces sp. NPDC002669]|uniref:transposase n=1 Tax=Streptomyces sp. NPDC002669 TaxID=3364658 RepID=UPI0036C8AAFD